MDWSCIIREKWIGPVPRACVWFFQDVATGMAYLSEQGLQHRNLHSHNVLITKQWGAKVCVYVGRAGAVMRRTSTAYHMIYSSSSSGPAALGSTYRMIGSSGSSS